jgi:NAD(P)-dependent dehydrogenase (short-subunit alcohol dehydrogenase family)
MPSGTSEPRVFLVTGASGTIGEAIARGLAEDPSAEVVLACRNEHKARSAADRITFHTGNPKVRCEIVDLSIGDSIEALAARWRGPLHVLVNNAATAPRTRQTTAEGLERQFATNVLGYFRMIRAFTRILTDSLPARVVNVASYWAGDLELDDLEFTRRPYDNDRAYRQSKQADRMLTVAFADRLPDGVAINACHPGDVSSQLSRDLGFGGREPAERGAATPVLLAIDPIGAELSGAYFEHGKPKTCRFSKDHEAIDALYAACERVA